MRARTWVVDIRHDKFEQVLVTRDEHVRATVHRGLEDLVVVRIPTGSHPLDDFHDLHQWRKTRQKLLPTRTRDMGIELR